MAKKTTIDTILRTKLNRPPVPGDHVHRPRLLEYLDQRRERPLALVSAPAGYGKSVLISCWLETSDRPSAWLSLDEKDNDLRQFLSYFLAAIQTMFPDAVSETMPLVKTSIPPPVSVLVHNLANGLATIEQDFILVLDDIHRITGKSVYDFLTELLQHPPRPMHLVLTGRRDPNLPIASLRARGQITEVRTHDLRFTDAEVKEYLEMTLGDRFEDITTIELANKTEGWVTGLRLAVLATRRQNISMDELIKLKGTTAYVMDYLISEVLNAQSPVIRQYLLSTSILDRITADLCDAMFRPDPSQGESEIDGVDFIATLQNDNLFLMALDTEDCWFRYHHLFQVLLQKQLNRKYRSEEIATLHTRASAWFEAEGLVGEALQHALAAGDTLAAAQIVERNRRAALSADQWHSLLIWLDKLPHEIKQERTDLLLCQAWILLFSARMEELFSIIKRVESLLDKEPVEPTLLSETNFFRGLVSYFQGEGARSAEIFNKATELLPESAFPVLRSEVEYWTCMALHLAGRKETAIQRLYQRLRSRKLQEEMILSRLTFGLCFIHMLDGEFLQAFQEGLKLRAICRPKRLFFADTWGMYVQGNASFQMFDLDAAQHHFSRVVENRYIANRRAAVDAMAGLAITRQFMGEPDQADETMRLAQEFTQWTKESEYLDIVHSCQARLALLRGDIDSASRWQRALRKMPGIPMMFFFLEIPAITECRVLIAIGSDASLKGAMERLENIYQKAKAWQNTCRKMEILALQALVSHRQGRLEVALETLTRAVAIAMPGGSIRPFVEPGLPMADMLKKLAEKDVAVDFIETILADFKVNETGSQSLPFPPSPHPPVSPSPIVDPLTNRELDVLELLAQRLRNKEIAEKLFISDGTVKGHLKNIYQKLNVSKRQQAVEKAKTLGILSRQ